MKFVSIANARYSDHWLAFSAGTQPDGYVHPKAIQVLSEIDIKHEGKSKSVKLYFRFGFDLVVTVCDDAAENCPVWLGKGKKIHMGFPDPAKAYRNEDEIITVFRSVRDDMLFKREQLLG